MLDSVESSTINIKRVSLSETPHIQDAPFVLDRDIPAEKWREIIEKNALYYNALKGGNQKITKSSLIYLASLHVVDPHQAQSFPLEPLWNKIQVAVDSSPPLGTFTTFSPHVNLLVDIVNLLPEKRKELPLTNELCEEFKYHLQAQGPKHGLYAGVLLDFMQLFPEEAAKIDKQAPAAELDSVIESYKRNAMWSELAAALSTLKILDPALAQKHLTADLWTSLKNQAKSDTFAWENRLRFIERLSILAADRVEIGENGIRLFNKDQVKNDSPRIPVVKAA